MTYILWMWTAPANDRSNAVMWAVLWLFLLGYSEGNSFELPATLNGLPALTLSLSYLSVFVETTEVVRALHKHTGCFFFQLPFNVRLRHWCHKSGIFLNCFCSSRNPPLHNIARSLSQGTVLEPD